MKRLGAGVALAIAATITTSLASASSAAEGVFLDADRAAISAIVYETAGRGYDLQKRLAETRTSTGQTFGAHISGMLAAASAADKNTDAVQALMQQIRLRDGSRLIDVVPATHLYNRSRKTETEPVSAPSTTSSASTAPSTSADTCDTNRWNYFGSYHLDADNYLIYLHLWAKTEFKRRCVGEPHIVQPVNADLVRARVAPTHTNAAGWPCFTDSADGSRSATKYDTHQVSVSWDMVRRPWLGGDGVSGHRAVLRNVVHEGSLCTE